MFSPVFVHLIQVNSRNQLKATARKMTRPTKLFHEIRPFIVIFSILGLWPAWPNSKYKILLQCYSVAFICYVLAMFWSAMYFNRDFAHHTLSAIVQFSFMASVLIAHFTALCEALVNRTEYLRLIEKFAYADRLLSSKLQLSISYRKEIHDIFIRFTAIVFLLVLLRTYLTYDLDYHYQINNFFYECAFSILLLRMRSIQVVFFVCLLRKRLRLVSEKLKEMLVTCNLYGKTKSQWTFSRDTSKIFVLDMTSAKHSVYDRLLSLKQIYGELYEISELMNITFGWSLLTIVAQSFFDFTGSCYWIFLALEESDYPLVIDCMSMFLPIISLIITMVYLCSSCTYRVSSYSVE